MGRTFTDFVAGQFAANGFWYCYTAQESMADTPLILIPLAGAAWVAWRIIQSVFIYWDA